MVKTINGGNVTTGERQIEPAEAAVIERIFREFVAGVSPKAIGKKLNQEGIAGPFGGAWSPSTLYGSPKRGTGVLNNELYVGRLVWNRLRYVKNPDTGKRVSRLNSKSEWLTRDVPQLRVISDERWAAAKVRQQGMRKVLVKSGHPGVLRRPRYPDGLHLQVKLVAGACNPRNIWLLRSVPPESENGRQNAGARIKRRRLPDAVVRARADARRGSDRRLSS